MTSSGRSRIMARRQDTTIFLLCFFTLTTLQIAMASEVVESNPLDEYFKATQQCFVDMLMTPFPSVEGVICNRTWDGMQCWPDVAAGTVEKLPCPTYIFGEGEAYVYKTCQPSGNWQIDEYNHTSSNYSECDALITNNDVNMHHYLLTIRIIYKVGHAMSLVALSIAMVIFLYFKKLWCPRNIIHMNLFLSFILRAIIVFVRDSIQDQSFSTASKHEQSFANIDLEEIRFGNFTLPVFTDPTTTGCKLVYTLTQYLLACNYYWLLVEGVYLHTLITVAVFSERAGVKWYIALGWGFPLLFVIPWIVVQATVNDVGCWDAVYYSPYFWIIQGPVMLSIAVNFVLFLNIVRVLATKLRATNAAEAKKLRKLAKSTMVLIALFGLYYVVTLLIPPQLENSGVEKFRLAWDLILASFQGLAVAILYCFLNGEVKAEFSKRWHVRQLTRDINASRTYRNGHSTTFTNLTRKDSPSVMVKDSPQCSPTSVRRNEYAPIMVANGNVDQIAITDNDYTDELKVGLPAIDTNSNENTPICTRVGDIDKENNQFITETLSNSPRTPRNNEMNSISPTESPKPKIGYGDSTSEPDCLIPLRSELATEPTKIAMETVV